LNFLSAVISGLGLVMFDFSLDRFAAKSYHLVVALMET